MEETILHIDTISKVYGDTKVLKGINLEIQAGEFITLLGPSGCGKTTTLRIVAGLEEPDSGRILLEGKDVTETAPNHRNVNTVFQNYALFPHMSVAKNIGYSQRIRGVDKQRIAEDVKAALELVQLEGYDDRNPNQLSGGQKQRVAIARAIINQPKVLLLDEPLGALDLQLRYQMQVELKSLQQRLGITFIYITHDQEEALNMSDRIVVMKDGRFEQIGTPSEIYNHPKTSFVASFVGRANLIQSTITEINNDTIKIVLKSGIVYTKPTGKEKAGDTITVAIRSENADVLCPNDTIPDGYSYLKGIVTNKSFSAGSLRITIQLEDGSEFTSSQHSISCPTALGQSVVVVWAPHIAVIVDSEED